MGERHVDEVLDCYVWTAARRCRDLGSRGGFSGARLWRIDDPSGAYCLKFWPPEAMTARRLAGIHALLARARASGVDFVTAPIPTREQTTVLERDGRVWDLSTWLPGDADFHRRPSAARLEAACAGLARLHAAWTPPVPRRGPCPAVARRLECFKDWQRLTGAGWRPQPLPDDPVHAPAAQAWQLLPHCIERSVSDLLPWLDRDVPLHPCWCDPWHDHVLFTGDRVTGLVDHGSVKEDHAAADLARLLGSLAGDDAALRQRGIDSYRAVRPLADADLPLISLLDRTGLAAGAANWLRWLYHDRRAYPNRPAVAERLRGIVQRLTKTA